MKKNFKPIGKSRVTRLVALIVVMAALVAAFANETETVVKKLYGEKDTYLVATRFKDVPTTHWAYNDIEALATGKLVNGVGGGMFSPDTKFTISQMSQIIANAKGYDTNANKGEYWWTAAVNYCLDIGCLPNFGAVTPENYDVECSRELAVYMVVTGLGIPAGKTAYNIEADYIPDFGQVDMAYRDAILKAYQYKLLTGVDSNHTFKPQNGLARSEACAILNRAGYTTAAVNPTTGNGVTNEEVIAKLRATGLFTEETNLTKPEELFVTETTVRWIEFTAKDRKYANLKVRVNVENTDRGGAITISADEIVPTLTYTEDTELGVPNILDENGNVFCDRRTSDGHVPYYYNADGKYMPASGLSYSSRQLLKQVLNIVYPTKSAEAYADVMNALTPPHTYANGEEYPSATNWYDSRAFLLECIGGYKIIVGALDNTRVYDNAMGEEPVATHKNYVWQVKGELDSTHVFKDYVTAYELTKW